MKSFYRGVFASWAILNVKVAKEFFIVCKKYILILLGFDNIIHTTAEITGKRRIANIFFGNFLIQKCLIWYVKGGCVCYHNNNNIPTSSQTYFWINFPLAVCTCRNMLMFYISDVLSQNKIQDNLEFRFTSAFSHVYFLLYSEVAPSKKIFKGRFLDSNLCADLTL